MASVADSLSKDPVLELKVWTPDNLNENHLSASWNCEAATKTSNVACVFNYDYYKAQSE